jgi:hypothetical protein
MRKLFTLLLLAIASPLANAEEKPDPAGIEFFESKVRPVLVEHCYKCHSHQSEKLKGNLYLDTRDGVLKGGDTGPAIVPGDPEKSLLIKAVRYKDENLQMPPKGQKLSSEQVGYLETWVKMGAPDPRTGPPLLTKAQEKAKTHWAFQPIRDPAPPQTKRIGWVENGIDSFILAKLEQNGMTASPKADRRTLIRRATFDLLGLPPTPEEVVAFELDESPRAYEDLIDRLLSSPQYGERWARHWLDVARYADTKGYVFEEERRYPYSYTYRDYVIRAFNNDLPFDRFIVEQLAADLLPLGEDKRPLAAMGFLTLGRRFLNNQPDIIDDRIDVVCRGMMALTVGCARCHDHKYDPIPTADYYSLYGVFASSSEPAEKPVLGAASLPSEYPEYQAERKKRLDEQSKFRQEKQAEILAQLRSRAGDYVLTAIEAEKLNDGSKTENLAKERKLDPGVVRRWMEFLKGKDKQTDPIFAALFAFSAIAETNFLAEARPLAERFHANESSNPLNPLVAKMLEGDAPKNLKEVGERYGKLFKDIDSAWVEAKKQDQKIEQLPDSDKEKIRQVLYASNAPANLPPGEIPRLFDVPTAQKNRALQRKVEELDATHPGAPPRGMVLQDNSNPYTPHIFMRGNARNPGPEVPRQFLSLIAGEKRKPFQKGSGRLELAQAIASKDNPLTARVIVNRVWLNHFGVGLVRTPSDFGVRSDPPTHPELLDYLASRFIADGWSLKKLHRLIMLSATYQQRSDIREEYLQKDPANQFLSHMNRQRLEFEPFRDTLLAVSGKINLAQFGHAVDLTTKDVSRRSIYGFVERQNLPGIFRTFDFASPDTTSPQRFNTTVPQQALFMINSPFSVEQARDFASRPEIKGAATDRDRIRMLYEVALQRAPSSDEISMAQHFVKSQNESAPAQPPVIVWQYGYGEYDPATQKIVAFKRLPHFTGDAWQGGANVPDEKLGWLMLKSTTGHPGSDLKHVIVRRWTSPVDATISINGTLSHEAKSGDGVRGHIISSRLGELGSCVVENRKATISLDPVLVKKNDTIDFVVDCRASIDSDSFTWAPVLKNNADASMVWSAKEDFSGVQEMPTPLNSWEKLAQVLLMSNELAFVD